MISCKSLRIVSFKGVVGGGGGGGERRYGRFFRGWGGAEF